MQQHAEFCVKCMISLALPHSSSLDLENATSHLSASTTHRTFHAQAQTLETTAAGGGRGVGFGIDHDLAMKQQAKYDLGEEAKAQAWIEGLTGEPFTLGFGEQLKDGVTLCKAMNVIKPGAVKKINSSTLAFKQMENVTFFLKACRGIGVPQSSLFETPDCYELKDLGLVVQCIYGLAKEVRGKAEYAHVPELLSATQAAAEAGSSA